MLLVLAAARGLHPLPGYRLRQGLLLALPASVLLAPWLPVPALMSQTIATVLEGPSVAAPPDLAARIELGPAQVDAVEVLLGLATIVVALLALFRLTSLARDLRHLHRLRLAAPALDDEAADRTLRELADRLDVQRSTELLEGPRGCAPMTFHWRHPAIVVPRGLLHDRAALRIALAHELIHVRRHDYAWTVLGRLASAAFAFHPMIRLLQNGIDHCRETSCDAEVVASGVAPPEEYAEVLVRTLAHTQVPMTAVAAGMATRSPTIKERLKTMKQFATADVTSRLRSGSALAAALLFLLTTTLAACVGPTEQADSSRAAPAVESGLLIYPTLASDTDRNSAVSRTLEVGQAVLRRLEVELTYLRERTDELQAQADAIEEEDYGRYSELVDHQLLLNEMLKERLRQFETLRMNQETLRRLHEDGS
jgi:beta-lactamase regulating signal transducer with metallopeptidase domain